MPKVERLNKISELAEQAPEDPTIDPEVKERLDALGEGIKSKEDLLAGLGRVAREKILSSDAEAEKEINAPKEVGRVDLKAEHDAQNFESAEKRGWWKRFWLKEPKHNMAGKDGVMVDTRKLKPGVKEGIEKGQTKFFPGELEEATEKLGLTPEEVKAGGLSMEYVEGRSGMEKMLKRAATPEEGDKVAAEILERQLKEQEQADRDLAKQRDRQLKEQERAGADLAKQRTSLESFRKARESISAMLAESPETLAGVEKNELLLIASIEDKQAKIAENERLFIASIESKQAEINKYKEKNIPPLEFYKDQVEEALAHYLGKFSELTAEEKKYQQQIEEKQAQIDKLGAAKKMSELLGESLGSMIREFEEQKAKAKLHKQAFIDAKRDLNETISIFKKIKAEVDKKLERIKKLGKTPAELKAEQEAEKQRKGAEAAAAAAAKKSSQSATAGAGAAGPVVGRKAGGIAAEIDADQVEEAAARERAEASDREALDQDDSSDDLPENPNTIRRRAAYRRAVLQNREYDIKTPAGQPRPTSRSTRATEGATRTAPVAGAAVPEQRPVEGERAERGEITEQVGYWLNNIIKVQLDDDADRVLKEKFKIGRSFDPTAPMTLEQAMYAYRDYLIELRGMNPDTAEGTAERHFKRIFKNEEGIVSAIEIAVERLSGATRQAETTIRAGMTAPETGPAENRGAERKETEIVRPIRLWLNAIFGGTLNPHDDQIMRRHFRLGGTFNKFSDMTSSQAERALKSFLREAEGFLPGDAQREARKKIGEIVENIDKYNYNSEDEGAVGVSVRATGRSTQTPEAPAPEAANRPAEAPKQAEITAKAKIKEPQANLRTGAKTSKIISSAAKTTPGEDLVEAMRTNDSEKLAEREAELKNQTVFSNAEWLVILGSDKVKGPKKKAVKKCFASPQMTLDEAVDGYMGYLKEINGEKTITREDVEALIKKSVKKYEGDK